MFEIDDSAIYPGEFGTTEDQLGYIALTWIKMERSRNFKLVLLMYGTVHSMNVFGDLWDNRPIQPMGGAIIRRYTEK